MVKDFTHTEGIIFCPACGAKNLADGLSCVVCKAPLIHFSLFDKEEKLYDGFNEQVFIFDEIRALKESVSEIKKTLFNLEKEIKNLGNELRSLYNYFSALKEILEENNYLRIYEVQEKWKEKETAFANIEDQLSHFIKKRESILSKYKGNDFEGFANLIEKALKKFRAQDLKTGTEILKKALKKDRKNYELLNFLAFLNLKNKDKKEADFYLKKSLKLEKNPETIFLKAWSLSFEEKFEEALNLIKEIKDEFQNPFLLYIMEGNLNFSLKNYKKAAISFQNALNYEENSYARFYLFKSLNFLNKKKNSIKHLEKIKDDEFYREDALYNLGRANFYLGKNKAALNYFKELLEEFPFKLKYQFSFLFAKENLNLENLKNLGEDLEIIDKKINEEDYGKISKKFSNLYERFPDEPFFLLSIVFFDLLKKRYQENEEKIKNLLKEKNYEIYKILGYLIYFEILKNVSNNKLSLMVSKEFYKNCKSQLGRAISLLFLSQKIFEFEKDEENALKFSKEALLLLPEELKIYGIENLASLIYKIEKKEEVYNILKELSENLKEESVFLNLGKIALSMGKEKDAKEIFKNMRDFQGKPQGILFRYWKELFNEIRSYLV